MFVCLGSGLGLKIRRPLLLIKVPQGAGPGPNGIKNVTRVENHKMVEIVVENIVPRKPKTQKGGETTKVDPRG